MSITLNVANGFKIEEVKRENNNLDLSIHFLIDGEFFSKEEHINISEKEKEKIVTKCIAMNMYNLDLAKEMFEEEREKIAEKVKKQNAINGYVLSQEETEDKNFINVGIEFLKNGEFFTSTNLKIRKNHINTLKKKLTNIVKENFNINSVRPIYLVEILALIE